MRVGDGVLAVRAACHRRDHVQRRGDQDAARERVWHASRPSSKAACAIRRPWLKPPQRARSGWTMSRPPRTIQSRKAQIVASCSAAAILSGLARRAGGSRRCPRRRAAPRASRVVLGEPAGHLERVLELPAPADVDHDVDVGPAASRAAARARRRGARRSRGAPAELQRAVPVLDLLRDVAPHRVGGLRHERARIDPHGVAEAPAEEPVDGWPSARPTRSCSAMSIAEIVWIAAAACRRAPSSRRGRARSARCRRVAAEQRLAHADEHRMRGRHVDEGLATVGECPPRRSR